MIIQQLKLQGIRSWEQGEINFKEGFTAIVGPKGAGKSSMIDGFELALFGDKAFQEYHGVIREGSSSSEVELNVEHQGRNYGIKRGLIRVQNAIAQDPSRLSIAIEDTIYTRSKATDLDRDVQTLLNIDKDILECTCLTKQEELKRLLNMSPGDRKKIVDKLLQLDAFETAWDKIGDIITGREGYLKRLKEDAAKYDLEALSKQYNQMVQQVGAQKRERDELQKKCDVEKVKLEELKQIIERLDRDAKQYSELKGQIEQQQKQLAEEKGKAERIGGQMATYQQTLDGLEKEEAQLKGQLSSSWSEIENVGYERGRALDALGKWIKELEESATKLSNTISVDQKALEEETQRELELKGKEDCPYCGQPLSSHKAEQFRQERLKHIETLKRATLENQSSLARATDLKNVGEKIYADIDKLLDRLERLQYQAQDASLKIDELQQQLKGIQSIISDIESQIKALEASLPPYDEDFHNKKRKEWMEQTTLVSKLEGDLQAINTNIEILGKSLDDMSNKIQEGQKIHEKVKTHNQIVEDLKILRKGCRAVLPDLRTLYLRSIESYVQKTYNDINPASTFLIRIDENYTPEVKIGGHTRSYRDLSGGERTDIALAYRIGLGNAIYEARTGTPMELLILDEPTENLGNEEEDRSIEHLAQMLSNLKVRQIITITHDQTFARFADHTIQIRKINEQSQIV